MERSETSDSTQGEPWDELEVDVFDFYGSSLEVDLGRVNWED
jgi:hypothetical protein